MKKALVVFLILAVAGGLFAQATWGGDVSTGLGIGFTDADGDKPLIDYVRNAGENGLRANVNFNYKGGGPDKDGNPNPYGTWGLGFGFRAEVARFTSGESYALAGPQNGNVWWQPTSSLYLALGGGANKDVYGTPGGLGFKQSIHDADGLKVQIIPPVAGLSVGLHAFFGKTLKNFEDTNYGLGVNYAVPDLLTIVANFRYKPEETKNADGVITKSKDNAFDAGAGVNFIGLSSVGLTKLAADVGTYNFGDKSIFYIGIGESIQFKALENLLVLDLSGQQYLWMGEESNSFIPMRIRAGLSYTIDKIVPAINVQYTMGNSAALNYRDANEVNGVGGVAHFANKDKVALGISPKVTFNYGPTLVIGYNLQMDMSDPKPTTKTMSHLIYGTVAISF